jgi:hypothetical protein
MARGRSAQAFKLAATTTVLLVALLIRLPYCTNDLLLTDNADYIRSVRGGLSSVYFERGSANFFAFAKLIRDRASVGAHPWDYFYRLGDAAALRHFHVPGGFYADALVVSLHMPVWVNRTVAAVVGSALCGIIFLYLGRVGVPVPLALAGTLLVAADPRFVSASTDINPHTWFLLFAVLFLFSLVDFIQYKRKAFFIGSIALLAVSCATLEYGPALVLTAASAIAICWRSMNLRSFFASERKWKAVVGISVFLGSLLLLWPGGVSKGGYLKSYGVFVWQALFQREQLFGPLTPAAIWNNLFGGSWAAALLGAWAIVGGFWIGIRKSFPPALAFFVYSVLALGMNLGNRYRNPTYAAEVMVPLLITSLVVTSYVLQRGDGIVRRRMVYGAVTTLCVLGFVQGVRALPSQVHRRPLNLVFESMIMNVPRLVPAHAIILVNKHREVYSLYFPDFTIEATEGPTTIAPLAKETTRQAEYLLLDTGGVDPKIWNNIDLQYAHVTDFGSSATGVLIGLYHKR